MAICFRKKEKYDDVIHEATKAINYDNSFKKAYENRILAFEKLEKDEDALEGI